MRIAFISYEYPPDISAGGIATYTLQVAKMMKLRGHDVEVFSGSFDRDISEVYESVLTHRIKITDVHNFKNKVVNVFRLRHEYKKFDIFESPEINGNGYLIKKEFPNIPMVVKLHTPSVLQVKILNTYTPFTTKLRFFVGALRKGYFDLGYWSKYDKNQKSDIDFKMCELADSITSPSVSLKKWAISFWNLPISKLHLIPNPYIPTKSLLDLPIKNNFKQILFWGKLNIHKGMVAYAKCIPYVLKKYPSYKFLIVAKDGPSHEKNKTMKEYMIDTIGKYIENIEFREQIPLEQIPKILNISDIVVIPSIWDNFPTVCLESMSAGKAIVASNQGGMKDMLQERSAGLLVNPLKPKQIAKAIIKLIENPELRMELGKKARQRVLAEYNANKIGKQMEELYLETIANN